MTTIPLTEGNLAETVAAHDIVLVDFWAAWCGPCRQFAPIFEAASSAHPDVVFGKVDTEAEPGLQAYFQVTAIPTVMAFREGVLVFSQPGALPGPALTELIGAVKGLDMDDVRLQVAAAQAAEAAQAQTPPRSSPPRDRRSAGTPGVDYPDGNGAIV